MSVLWSSYLRVLERRPLRTQMVQTAVIMAIGDGIAQAAIEKRTAWALWDAQRTARFAALGAFMVAPAIRGWYLTLERLVSPRVSHPLKATVAKVALDQTAFAPLFNGLFISVLGAMQGKTVPQVGEKLKREYKDVIITNWKLWPAVQMVNFFVVPFNLRPLVAGVVALFWNTYLSWKSNK